jgi:hypothetical protein
MCKEKGETYIECRAFRTVTSSIGDGEAGGIKQVL